MAKIADVKELSKQRTEIFRDLFNGRVPTKVPVTNALSMDAASGYCGIDVAEAYWDSNKLEIVFDKVSSDFYSDTAPGAGRRWPAHYQMLGSKPYVMSSRGYMQHPNVMGMFPDNYDDFIESPLDCVLEKILPRLYTKLDTDPNSKALVLAKAMKSWYDDMGNFVGVSAKMINKYGFAAIPGGQTTAPFDFMSDFFRSFTGIITDIRRYPEKVLAASEAMLPISIIKGSMTVPSNFCTTMIPLHMGPFMNTRDFEKFYFPTLKKQVEGLSSLGINVQLFVEHDYTRYLDHLSELPEYTIFRFEYGDPRLIKEKLGKKFIITGLYPVMLLHDGTKQQCIDKAKEHIDILAPGGGYWFATDKEAFETHGNLVENWRAVAEYVSENAIYSEAERSGNDYSYNSRTADNAYEILGCLWQQINSKYFTPWEQYRKQHQELEARTEHALKYAIGPKMQRYEDMLFKYIVNLCS